MQGAMWAAAALSLPCPTSLATLAHPLKLSSWKEQQGECSRLDVGDAANKMFRKVQGHSPVLPRRQMTQEAALAHLHSTQASQPNIGRRGEALSVLLVPAACRKCCPRAVAVPAAQPDCAHAHRLCQFI